MSEFDHFAGLNAQQQTDADATLATLREKMTDQAYADLISSGVIQATQDKESAARIISGLLTAAKTVTKIMGVF